MMLQDLLKTTKPPAVGTWNLSGEDQLRFYWKYKGLVLEQQRNNAFWLATNENLSAAYEKLDRQERELELVNGLNQKYLDHIHAGILMIDRNFTVLDQYSKYVETLFKNENIAKSDFLSLIYGTSAKYETEREELKKFLSILFKNLTANMSMIMDINPLNNKTLLLHEGTEQAAEIVIDAQFTRIYENDEVENIMIFLEDRTEIVRMEKQLKEEQSKYEAELESISAILRAGPKAFLDFIEEAQKTLNLFENNYENLEDKTMVNRLFREIHSLKGTAKYFELKYIVSLAHRIEDTMTFIKNEEKAVDKSIMVEIREGVDELFKELRQIELINDKVLKFSIVAASARKCGKKDELCVFFKSLKEMTHNISEELGKEVRLVIMNKLENFPMLNEIKNPIIHLIRNSLDHGLEDQYERLSKLKGNKGNIKMNLYEKENFYIIELVDDGRGINYDKIKAKAIERNLITADSTVGEKELLQLIFSPSFSSKDTVSDMSGRGYGLDIVKDAIDRLKGKITVATKKDLGTRITLKIPVQPKEG